jgi:ornithine cyclodeaminase
MRVVGHEEAMGVLDYGELIDFMHEQHRRPPAIVGDSYVESDGGDGLLARTGFAPGQGLGVKLASVFPGNVDRPTVHSVYVLFDADTGRARAAIAGNAITWFKTACDSGLASRELARRDARNLLMVGAGAMAPHLIRAHLAARPTIERVTIWNRTRSRADDLAAEMAVEATVAEHLAPAVGEADVVTAATMAVEPVIRGDWVQPGTHIDLVGSYRPDMREADDALMERARIFVDSRDTTVTATGELAIPIADGVISPDDVLGDHYQLAAGEVAGRTSADDVTAFKNGGGGHLDLMTAQFIVERLERD